MVRCTLAGLAMLSSVLALATPPLERFDITGYAVEGAPLLHTADFSRIVAPFIGRQKSAADVQSAQRLLQRAYLDLGHCAVEVVVPSAEPQAGVVTFKVLRSRGAAGKDCLPVLALDAAHKPPVADAPDRAAARDVTQWAQSAAPPAPALTDTGFNLERAAFKDRTFALAQVDAVESVTAPVMPAAIYAREAPPQGANASGTPPPALLLAQAPATEPAIPDEPAPALALKFDIERYVIEGNTLLKPAAIEKVLRPYVGKQKDFADVQRALEAVQIAYQKEGWGAVQVTLPEQELERGEVRFVVIETRVGKINVQAGEYFNEANILRSVPSLKVGGTPNSHALARSLNIANENPDKQTQVSLKAGEKDGEVEAVIKVVDENPRKYSLSMDNTGTSQSGRFRVGIGFQHSNLWNRDHQLTLQYSTSPDNVNKVTILGAGYHIPLYGLGDSVDFILGYSDVNSGTLPTVNLNVAGAGFVALARYNHFLNRIENYEHRIIFGLDYKALQSSVTTSAGTPLVPDITLHPVSATYAGQWRGTKDDVSFYAGYSYNPFPGGNDAAQSDFSGIPGSQFPTGARARATAEYSIWRYGGVYTRVLPLDWTLRLAATGQTTRNALVAGEQFGVGGASSVRGFNERAYSNDKGHQASLELYTPDIAGKLGFPSARLKFLAFYDTATAGRNLLQSGDQTGFSVDSVGLGARLNVRDKLRVQVDYAQVLHDGGRDSTLPNGRRNSNTVHAAAMLVF
jgi:hemolysin activation/secretion protein